MKKISVIIPTYNRFEYLINAIKSVNSQTYDNVEIIVVNDRSESSDYYDFDWLSLGVRITHLERNTREIFGYPCAGFVRNVGMSVSSGDWIAFLDDDDYWLPHKLELQMLGLKDVSHSFSCTEGLIGKGKYIENVNYPKYNQEFYLDQIKSIFKDKNSELITFEFPPIWTIDLIKIHNCIITSSVLLKKELAMAVGSMGNYQNGQEDYDYWLRCLQLSDCIYIKEPCIYYDLNHGHGH